jgi:hypothetical protein
MPARIEVFSIASMTWSDRELREDLILVRG